MHDGLVLVTLSLATLVKGGKYRSLHSQSCNPFCVAMGWLLLVLEKKTCGEYLPVQADMY
jgi:hypothetical protein